MLPVVSAQTVLINAHVANAATKMADFMSNSQNSLLYKTPLGVAVDSSPFIGKMNQ
ncbi:hypothetical protein Z946_4008 [Sulfitobacter noctilucicola]|nr:hypothetical protein Z946_4008 [Sulfitobacter noctilucicola]